RNSQPCILFINLWTRKHIHHFSIIILDISHSHLPPSSLQVYINFTEKRCLCFMLCAIHLVLLEVFFQNFVQLSESSPINVDMTKLLVIGVFNQADPELITYQRG